MITATPQRRRALKRELSDDKENHPNAANQQAKRPRLAAAEMTSSHVEVPYPLVGREKECTQLDTFLESSLSRGPGKGGCLYVSGGPGTGKTCSVSAAARKWQQQNPKTKVLLFNCMHLTQRSVSGLLSQMLQDLGARSSRSLSTNGLVSALVSRLAELDGSFVIIVDEVDQIVHRRGRSNAGECLSSLFALPQLPGAPPLALVTIANAVDLLGRTSLPALSVGCDSLLFEPYSAEQLRQIIKARLEVGGGGDSALKALGPMKLELRVRQVAKQCGDCRQVLSLCEEALFDVRVEREEREQCKLSAVEDVLPEGVAQSTPEVRQTSSARPLGRSQQNNPLLAVPQLPLEQQVLLCALAGAQKEALRLNDVCTRYKEMCRLLKQNLNLTSKGQISSALSSLEQRGLIELRGSNSPGGRRGRSAASGADGMVELAVAREALREHVVRANPCLKRCFE